MTFNKKFLACEAGATMMLVGLMLIPVLLAAMGIAVDMGRLYAVQSKAQNALDAALLGAVSTANDPNTKVATEVVRLFNANFPANYMGSTHIDPAVSQGAPDAGDPTGTSGVYTATVNLTVPNVIMDIVGQPSTAPVVSSQVTKNFQVQSLELTLVLDNTGSMNCAVTDPAGTICPSPEAGSKISNLIAAAKELTTIIFNSAGTNNNVTMSIVPFASHVNLGSLGGSWVQNAFVGTGSPTYTYDKGYYALSGMAAYGGHSNHYLSNRTIDTGTDTSGHTDSSDAAPGSDINNFRTPYAFGFSGDSLSGFPVGTPDPYNPSYIADTVYPFLAPIKFGLTKASDVNGALGAMTAGGSTRIDVGLLWGWMTLSPNWNTAWGGGTAPAPYGPLVHKVIVLMTDGENAAGYDGTNNTTNDDTETANLCTTIKQQGLQQGQPITIYTIGYGTAATVNQTLLEGCATDTNKYWLTPDNPTLTSAFSQIADDILNNTLSLSK